MSESQTKAKLAAGGSLGGISFCLCVVSLYWILRINRKFRHQLQLLLILTDLFKSLAYLALPLAAWGGYDVDSMSLYCQFSGFIMGLTVEATDFLMLVIAIQTALCVFREYHNPGFSDLHNYRWIIYLLWVIIPMLMASLAFTNPQGGYVSVGAFCYLPRNPMWYRLGLAWIPRGIIFFIILLVQSAIYVHVNSSIRVFRKVENISLTRSTLINDDQSTQSRIDALELILADQGGLLAGNAKKFSIGSVDQSHAQYPVNMSRNPIPYTLPIMDQKPLKCQFPINFKSLIGSSFSTTETKEPFDPRLGSQTSNMTKKRIEIQQNVQLLFIYPLAYLLMWFLPMIIQILQYVKGYAAGHVPFWMSLSWGIVLAAHGAVDTLVFLLYERPWKKEKLPLPKWASRLVELAWQRPDRTQIGNQFSG